MFNNTERSVSIVIPTFNRAHLLKKTIDSALNQSYKCEIIVCNHGSTDETDKLVYSYKDKIKYIKKIEDYGPHFCWLDGVIQATGEFIHLQYDDDVIDNTFIEKCMALIDDDTGFSFASPKIYNPITKKYSYQDFKNFLPSTGVYLVKDYESKLIRTLISPSAAIYRKTDVIDALYQGKLPLSKTHYHGVGPDSFITLLSMLRYKKFGYVSENLACFLAHEGSITINASKEKETELLLINSYREVRRYYNELKFLKKWRLFSSIFPNKYLIKDFFVSLLNRKKKYNENKTGQ